MQKKVTLITNNFVKSKFIDKDIIVS